MIIAVDGNEANVEKKVGVSVYTYKLLAYFQKKANKDVRFVVFLRKNPAYDLPPENDYYSYRVVPGAFAWSQIFLPFRLFMDWFMGKKYAVFFSPAHYAPRFLPCRSVVTIHDLSYLYFPNEFLKKDLYQLTNWTQYSVARADKVIAVSNATRNDVLKEYQVAPDRIITIYNGFDITPRVASHERIPTGIEGKRYLLFVGTIQPRKNIVTLLHAVHHLLQKYPDLMLVIAGKKGWLYEDTFAQVKQLHLHDHVFFAGFVKDEIKTELYRHALCLVLPSLYEGFGLPLLEAMSVGCPTITSNASSLPEVGGQAALYIDPHHSEDIEKQVDMLITDPQFRAALIEKGYSQVKTFSWEMCGEKTLQVLLSVVK